MKSVPVNNTPESLGWVTVKLADITPAPGKMPIAPNALHCATSHLLRNDNTMGAEYGDPLVGEHAPEPGRLKLRELQIIPERVCCLLSAFQVKQDDKGRTWIYGKALPFGTHAQEVAQRFKDAPNDCHFTMRGIKENGVLTHILSWDYIAPDSQA